MPIGPELINIGGRSAAIVPDIIRNAEGKSRVSDGSYWASGSALLGTERRHLVLHHTDVGIDSNHSGIVQLPYGRNLTTESDATPLNSPSNSDDDYSLFFTRLSLSSNEMCVYLRPISEGWQVCRYKVLCNFRRNSSTAPPLLQNSRSAFYTRSLVNTGTGTRASDYVSQNVDTGTNTASNPGTNAWVTLDTPLVGNAQSFGVIWLPFITNNSMILAATIEIERVPT